MPVTRMSPACTVFSHQDIHSHCQMQTSTFSMDHCVQQAPVIITWHNNMKYSFTFTADDRRQALTTIHVPARHRRNVQPLSGSREPAIWNAQNHLQSQSTIPLLLHSRRLKLTASNCSNGTQNVHCLLIY